MLPFASLQIFTRFIGHPQHRCWAPSRHSHHRSCLGTINNHCYILAPPIDGPRRFQWHPNLAISEWWVNLQLWIGNGNINSPCHHFVGFQPTPFQMCASPHFTSMQGVLNDVLLIFTTIPNKRITDSGKKSLKMLWFFLGTPCLCRQTPFNISMRITHGQDSTILAPALFGASRGPLQLFSSRERSKPKTSSHTHLKPNEKR